MKRFVCLCFVCTLVSALILSVAGSAVPGAVPGQVSPGADFDAGNNARTGDIQSNGGSRDGSAGGTANGNTTGEDTAGDYAADETGAAIAEDNGTYAGSAGSGAEESAVTEGAGWFTVILGIVIVAAVIALAVALLPRRNRM